MDQKGRQHLVELVIRALKEPANRKQLIDKFQRTVWDEESDSYEWECLRNLAYDLDFYEPDPKARSESSSFYGDNQIETLISSALERLRYPV